jgi:hypothetical protein
LHGIGIGLKRFAMKLKRWGLIKIALILFLTVGIVTYRVESAEDAWGLARVIALAFGFFALFQSSVWFIYDVMTLKRGGWGMTKFGDSPFARESGPGIYMKVEAVALLVFGAAKIVAAIFQGSPALVLGAALFTIGVLLLALQAMLRRLFQSRFAARRQEPESP